MPHATQHSHKEKFWQMLVCFVMMPLLIITSIYVYSREIEEKKKPRPEYEDVPWMGITHRPFPWGDGKRCFFHNPVKNPIPGEGYEVEDPNAVRKTEPKEARENEN
nr:PREDICTED: cytochrome c oxidase subunit 6A1, mitochondrial-like [Megachile rotundata]